MTPLTPMPSPSPSHLCAVSFPECRVAEQPRVGVCPHLQTSCLLRIRPSLRLRPPVRAALPPAVRPPADQHSATGPAPRPWPRSPAAPGQPPHGHHPGGPGPGLGPAGGLWTASGGHPALLRGPDGAAVDEHPPAAAQWQGDTVLSSNGTPWWSHSSLTHPLTLLMENMKINVFHFSPRLTSHDLTCHFFSFFDTRGSLARC